MPYISQESRENIDPAIDDLAEVLANEAKRGDEKKIFAGLLNYSITRLMLLVSHKLFGRIRYWIIAALSGMLKNVSDEFYRRVAEPYEEKRIESQGDVDAYEMFLEEIENKNKD